MKLGIAAKAGVGMKVGVRSEGQPPTKVGIAMKVGIGVNASIALVRRAVTFELALYRSLFRWITRRPDIPTDAEAFAYVGAIAALLWGFIFVSAIELVVLHLLLPWEAVRIVADILSLWGLMWMLGLMASFKVYPHLVGDSGIEVRHGAATDITIPWDAIATVAVRERDREKSRALQLDRNEQGTELNVVIMSRTNVDLTFCRPVVVVVRQRQESITELRLYADDARGLVLQVNERLASRENSSMNR